MNAALERLRAASSLTLLLDYDGTLVPFVPTPELAVPDLDLQRLLLSLAQRPNTAVHIVSGRKREDLERWFGALPIGLHAEHGYWSRSSASPTWVAAAPIAADWKSEVLALFRDLTDRTPGSLLEEKDCSVAWHYRMAEPALAAARLTELGERLKLVGTRSSFEVLAGSKVLEVRDPRANKGRVARFACSHSPFVLAAGDDTTDEDLFKALPPHGVAIRIGQGPTCAGHRLSDPGALRELLALLL